MTPDRDEDERLLRLLEAVADSVLRMTDEEVRAELAKEGARPGPSVGEIIAVQLKKTRPTTSVIRSDDVGPKTDPVRADVALVGETSEAESRVASGEAAASVTKDDILAFFEKGVRFTRTQQRSLFADPPTRERFLALKRQYAAPLPGGTGTPPGPAIAEIPTQIAAAGTRDAEFERALADGILRINPVGIGEQVYVVFSFNDITIATRVLILERARDERIERIELPPPDAGEILLIKDLAVPEESALVDLLRDPNTSGVFLR